MNRLVLTLFVFGWAPPDDAVEVQRPGDPPLWTFDWRADAQCPTRSEVIERIRSYMPTLEQPPLQVPRARLRFDASVELIAGEWTVRLELDGEQGSSQRSFSAGTCDELADAVALIAAVSLDPVVVVREVAALEPPEPETETDPAPALTPVSALEPEPKPEPSSVSVALPTDNDDERPRSIAREFRVGLRVFGGGGIGPTTTGFAALGSGVALFGRRWRWSLDGGGWLPRTLRRELAVARFSGWWVGSRGCFVPRVKAVELPLCGGFELGQIRGSALAPTRNPRDGNYPWVALSVGVGVTWVIHRRVAMTSEVALLAPLFSGSFQVGDQTLTRVAPVAARAVLGVELRL